MFIGHFGAGFGAKALAPRVSLGWLFAAAQFIDLLWPSLLLAGVERVRIAPGATAVTPLVFEHYPVSHSLAAVLGWARPRGRNLLRPARRTAAARSSSRASSRATGRSTPSSTRPISRWPRVSATVVGLGAWNSPALSFAIEVPLFAAGAWVYARRTAPADAVGRWAFAGLVAFLLAIHAGNLLGPPPPSVEAIAWVGQAQWLLVLWAYWVDDHRRAVPA